MRERSDNTTSYFFFGLALTMLLGWTGYQCKEKCIIAGRKRVKFIESTRQQRYLDLEDPEENSKAADHTREVSVTDDTRGTGGK